MKNKQNYQTQIGNVEKEIHLCWHTKWEKRNSAEIPWEVWWLKGYRTRDESAETCLLPNSTLMPNTTVSKLLHLCARASFPSPDSWNNTHFASNHVSIHFQDSCNKNTSKYVRAFYWYKIVSMVWLSLFVPVRNLGVIFPPRKKKTYSESLGRGWVSLLQML